MDGDIAAIADQIMPTIHPSWLEALQSDRELLEGLVVRTANRITHGEDILPAPQNILRALSTPVDQTKALIVGQDPYPTPGHAVGLSFSSYPDVFPFPKSLQNIFTEYESDLGYPRPATADLSLWVDQGVMLLNRVLTVRAGNAGSDQGLGWEGLTESVIRILASRQEPFVALLWGKPAQTLLPLIGSQRAICSSHPSPLSAYRGFFGSHPFSRANELLISQGGQPIEWKLP